MTAQRYRKKPVVIEAMGPLTQALLDDVADWVMSSRDDAAVTATLRGDDSGLYIDTLEGEMHASFGDYVVRGTEGEFYPCKPDAFAATFEPADA